MAQASLAPRLCTQCGTVYQPKAAGTKYCSVPCHWSHEFELRKARRAKKNAEHPSLKRVDSETGMFVRVVQVRVCEQCGVEYQPRSVESRYCSRACMFLHPGWRASMRKPKAPPAPKPCSRCGTPVDKRADKYCKPCRAVAAEASRIKKCVTHTATRVCQHCGEVFLSTPHRKYCSATCGRDAASKRRNVATRAVVTDGKPFSSVQVFARDKWRCHLCGIRTPRSAIGSTRRDAPQMDHIMPVSRGGAHTWNNVATACRACNAAKRDAPLGQFGLPFDVRGKRKTQGRAGQISTTFRPEPRR